MIFRFTLRHRKASLIPTFSTLNIPDPPALIQTRGYPVALLMPVLSSYKSNS